MNYLIVFFDEKLHTWLKKDGLTKEQAMNMLRILDNDPESYRHTNVYIMED